MRKELETIALIENYLGGKLSPEDQLQFEAEMAINDELRDEVELQRDLVGAILLAAFAEDVKHMHTELVGKPSKTLGKMAWYSLSGFMLIGGLTSAMFLWNRNEKPIKPEKQKTEALQVAFTSHRVTQSKQEEQATPPEKKNRDRTGRKRGKRNSKQEAVPFNPDQHRVVANLQNFQPSFRNVTMNPNEDFTFKMAESQSTVLFPANSIRNAEGKTVTGPVEIRYREYRDAADIAFSKIRMTVHEYGEELAFNSAGMFEIFAYQDGQKLSLDPKKPMVVDYNLTQEIDSLYFWQLDESNSWKKLRAIGRKNESTAPDGPPVIKVPQAGKIKLDFMNLAKNTELKNLDIRYKTSIFWQPVPYIQKTDSGYLFNAFDSKKLKVRVQGFKTLKVKRTNAEFGQLLSIDVWLKQKIGNRNEGTRVRKNRYECKVSNLPLKDSVNSNPELMHRNASKAVQQYTNITSGLQCPDFGIYNCDQTYRISDKVQIGGKFEDENGKAIDSPGMLSVIAAGVNGAISYWPNSFACSKAGTTLLLFTNDLQIYAMNKEEFAAMNILNDGNYTFKVRNMTAELTDANDLRRYLGLKEK